MAERWIGHGQAFIIAFDISSKKSFRHVRLYYNQIKRIKKDRLTTNPDRKDLCSPISESFPIMLIGNKSDLRDHRTVSTQQGLRLAQAMGAEYFETSAKEGFNVAAPFQRAVQLYREREKKKEHELFCRIEGGKQGTPKYRRQYRPFQKNHLRKWCCASQ
ncbi:hypothetical protein FE257_008526 [Aspergillus nanangensis]|uniref:Uncharacterized protein n=1 Tax=Aspergillus nanangensis TaxID=2582783 RepID=A0AAD4CL79_ASPNN|nr:hypothetical protein FE257_008526 [Aspergillus nanangensis]